MGAAVRVAALLFTLSVAASPGAEDVAVSGTPVPGLEPIDALFTDFLAERPGSGAAVCIARAGEIIYERGFGTADQETGEPVAPDAVFRTASLSKPITAVAILRLAELGRLSLDDNPFERIGLGPRLAETGVDPRLRDITVRQLLHHTAGWDREASFDPMFAGRRFARAAGRDVEPTPRLIIEAMLAEPLQFDPGTRYAYSNFGYSLLGRVIEAVTGQAYETAVLSLILEPAGAGGMAIGGSRPEDRRPGEVRYHDGDGRTGRADWDPSRTVSQPYRFDHEVLDAHGAWTSSAADLVRFTLAIDGPRPTRLLSPESLAQMVSPPPPPVSRSRDGTVGPVFYGCGWQIRPVGEGCNAWHAGQLPGTSTLLVRRHDGFVWAVLFNTDGSRDGGPAPAIAIDPLMHQAIAQVTTWPGARDG